MGTALITGASAGLGAEFAWQLAAEHTDVVLVARNAARLEELAGKIRNTLGTSAEALPADLANPVDLARVAERLRSESSPIGLLVNNAGFGLGQDFVGGDLERELNALDVMVRAPLVLSHAAAGAMAARGAGAIINVSSLTSLTAQGTYSAHKAWLRTFSEGLAAELGPRGVHVTAVTPGLIRTEFHERSHVDASQWPGFVFAEPETVVAAALDAARAGRVITTPTPLYKVASAALRAMPRALVRRVAGPSLSGRN
ncbi:short-subunit dehydrogenase [Arcanobacterium wilhelmae]|uniref:Short-subunit dehydrogenase n=1 Tax=Arcanobacterium wilhelmae TaxID=1803177 RepID=A0ABT9NB17_9ACTO|nr:SDR family NAD(P)-dependent oxidoreductase [Arcanobacterium wilhelmae]MDP9800685.1 short-subunit dehydrogenase [Arcanobacterium wilhelmae]WFN90085.1 SDR family NAD(P)-dependent oxidoreductase [Arcanobacterium wilhelmae]